MLAALESNRELTEKNVAKDLAWVSKHTHFNCGGIENTVREWSVELNGLMHSQMRILEHHDKCRSLRCTFSPRIINTTCGTQWSRPRLVLPAGVAVTASTTTGCVELTASNINLWLNEPHSDRAEKSFPGKLKSRNTCTFDLYLYTDLWSDVAKGRPFNGDVVKLWNHESWEWVLPRKTNH